METEKKLSHYQRNKECIYRNVVKWRAKKKLEKLLQKEEQMKEYNEIIIQKYLKNLIKENN